MTSVTEAEALIAARMPRRPVERVAIALATGRILAERIVAERDQPPFDRVTMDGIAIASAAWRSGQRRFPIQAVQAAGEPALGLASAADCIRVMTGAVRPEGTDSVIPVERLRLADEFADVDASATVEPGRFIHRRGSDRRAGETVLEPGLRIGPAEVAVLASAGAALVATAALPRVAVISTGDELVAVDAPEIRPWQIRSCNDLAVASSLALSGIAECRRVSLPDDPGTILASLERLHAENDMLILSGGVSMGDFDFVPAALEALGSELVFHRIEQKPGRPMWFGISGAGKPIFALPGNPVSTLLCVTRYVVPALRQSLGLAMPAAEFATLAEAVDGPKDLTYFVPVKLAWDESGAETASPRPTNTSGDFSSLAATDGFIELAPGSGSHAAGTGGRIFRW